MIVHLLLEGRLEEPVARRIIAHCGHEAGTPYGQKGVRDFREKLYKYHGLATHGGAVLALTDFMDSGAACPPEAIHAYLTRAIPNPSSRFLLRFAVNEIESWLLADREGMACLLGISKAKLPQAPDTIPNPKETLVALARRAKKKEIREGLAPPPGHGGQVGPLYTAVLSQFVIKAWEIEAAQKASPSLQRCVASLQSLG